MNLRMLVLFSVLVLAPGLSARAGAFLLTIDLTDPSNVTITATGALALEDSSTTSTFDGVDMLQFLTSAVVADPVVIGGLVPSGTTLAYDSWGTDSYSGSAVDINLYSSSESSQTQAFSTSTPAFTGTWTGLDFSSLGGLPSAGMSGDILAGYSGNPDGIIGQWVVVPEPSQYGFVMTLGLVGLFGYRRLVNRGAFRFASAISR
jgi:hypothetical protein